MNNHPRADLLDAIEEAERRAVEHLGRKALGLERLLAISAEIATLDLGTALDRILHHVLELTGTRRGALLLADTGAELRVERTASVNAEDFAPSSLSLSRSAALRAFTSGELVVIEDVASSPHCDRSSIAALGLKALIALPLRTRRGILGVLYVDTDQSVHSVSPSDLSLLIAYAAQAAIALENARLYRRLQDEHFEVRRAAEGVLRCGDLLYRSAAMHRVTEAIRQVAPTDLAVLVRGETGTGKELVARAIHALSRQSGRRYLCQNTGALTDTLLESELFGHRRGAFSGAVEHHTGIFEAADGGTVFLDEIGEASPALQVRLLRFLETGSFRRVGETVERLARVRVIAATHRDLEAEVRAGRFRADLYYRLGAFPIHVPPLRARPEDIEVLVEAFVERFSRELGKNIATIPAGTRAALSAHAWPGNVRELANVVQRLVLLATGDELAAWTPGEEPAAASATNLEEVEREHIRRVLAATAGNRSEAARRLGLKRGTLRWRLRKLGLEG